MGLESTPKKKNTSKEAMRLDRTPLQSEVNPEGDAEILGTTQESLQELRTVLGESGAPNVPPWLLQDAKRHELFHKKRTD